ncbi:MAG: DUF4886 domain-containing protein, partial [bacterium]|nr:DUF4886 domain-containing protein [bacterium]
HTNASAYQYRYNRVNFDPCSPDGLEMVFVGKDKAVIEYRDSFEYSLDRTNWQTSNAFSNLTADTPYSVYYRVAQASSISGATNFRTVGSDDVAVAPVSDGKLFSGWSVGSKGQHTANFVNKDVLAPHFQLASQTTVDSESTNIRLLSTVDSLDYDNVGYDIAIDGDEYSFQTRTVYSSVYAVDSTGKRNLYTAGQVGVQDVSNYIFCLEIKNVPKEFFDKKISVTPFWTVDGIKVYGKSRKVAVHGYLDNSIKVLAIGNSFSQDAYKYLYDILKANGYEDVVIGNAYAAGCDLKTHASKFENNSEGYTYYKYDNGVNTSESASMSEMIADEDWHIITLQQVSGSSGISDTYQPYLSELIDYIKQNRTVNDGKIAWHMTWAYKSDSTHAEFPNYDSDQMTMYNAIVGAVNSQIDTNDDIDFVIPAGTTIQNARTVIGDTLTRDGYHLNSLGSYLVGYTWLAAINGRPLTELEFFADDVQLTPAERELVVKYVNSALKDPYNVTDCNS